MTPSTFLTCATLCFALGCASTPSTGPTAGDPKGPTQGDEDTVQFSPPPGEQKGAPQVTLPRGAPPVSGSSQGAGDGVRHIERARVNEMLGKGPGWGLQQVQVEPAKDAGDALLGFRVLNLSPEAAAALAPLQPGDVVTHLNGVRLRRPEDLMDAWTLAQDIEELRLDYTHHGAPKFVAWSIK